jgi:2-C-methyl-D-erythritol 2,4-cyclodiphosphate synthase
MSGMRVGSGFDLHRLVAGRPLVLGGVQIAFEKGLEGHSDGDCLLHAVCDALLGAAGEGDMGQHFPSGDPKWGGDQSLRLVEAAVELVTRAGFAIENVDATVVAQAPPLAAHLGAMRVKIARALGIDKAAVSVKAKSTDGLGALGRGEGIAALATALLQRKASP